MAKGIHDGGQGLDQADDAAHGDSARTDIADIICPQLVGGHCTDGDGGREHGHIPAKKADEGHKNQPGNDAAGKHVGRNLRTADVADPQQGGQGVDTDAGAAVGGDFIVNLAGKESQALR